MTHNNTTVIPDDTRICPTCNGTGINPIVTTAVCPKCNGEKKVSGPVIQPLVPSPPKTWPDYPSYPYPYPYYGDPPPWGTHQIWCDHGGW